MFEKSAGGVVFRHRLDRYEILMIEDRFGRWTLPKGRKEMEETDQETALREVLEETGIVGRIVQSLMHTQYTYHQEEKGEINKEVVYFLIEAVDGKEEAQLEEINGVSWMSAAEAWKMQEKKGYENNQPVFHLAYEKLGLAQYNG